MALKVHRDDNSQFTKEMRSTIMTEVSALQKLNHPNIVNILDFEESGVLVKKNGDKYAVSCIVVEELAEGGESFFYVANSGFFDESVGRYFFRQFVDGLYYLH